jgi:hypothetical protein
MYDSVGNLTRRLSAPKVGSGLLTHKVSSDKVCAMLWSFERAGEQLHCEIRREGEGPGYELIVTHPDGSQRMERFEDAAALISRTLVFQQELIEEGWRSPKGRGP